MQKHLSGELVADVSIEEVSSASDDLFDDSEGEEIIVEGKPTKTKLVKTPEQLQTMIKQLGEKYTAKTAKLTDNHKKILIQIQQLHRNLEK